MLQQTVALAYSQDNARSAETITNALQGTVSFQHYIVGQEQQNDTLANQLSSFAGPIVLLVSDNFLRSTSAMRQGLRFLHESDDRLLPIIVDGYRKDEQTGEVERIDTDFDKVSDIIQYVNFWQDRYLDLRRQRRDVSGADEAAFDDYLRIVRDISSEVGEFLRLLRNTWHLSFQEFAVNDYQQLFIFLDAQDAWERYQAQRPSTPAPEPAEEPPVDLSEIPGLDQLGIDLGVTHEAAEPAPTDTPLAEPVDAPPQKAAPTNDMTDTLAPEELDIDDTIAGVYPEEWEEEAENDSAVAEEVTDAPSAPIDMDEQVPLLIHRAWELADNGDAQAGLHILEASLDTYAGRTDLRYHYALMLAQQEDADTRAAIEQLEMILQIDPDHLDTLFLLGELAEISGDVNGARRYYERVLSVEPNYPDANQRMGALLLKAYPNERELAARHYEYAVTQSPDNVELLYPYALLLNDPLRRPDASLIYLDRVLRQQPDHAFAHYDKALLYHQRQDTAAAYDAYQAAIRNNPDLRTPENDRAFTPTTTPTMATTSQDPTRGHETLSALRENINQLENLLQAREAEAQQQALESRPGHGKTVLITGATSGIGLATAEAFAEGGFRLILTGRRQNRLTRLQEYFDKAYETDILTLPLDVTDRAAAQRLIDGLGADWQHIDILINNAGKAKGLDYIHEGNLDHWDEMIDTNIKGLLYMTRAVTPGMVARGKGHIINVCSTSGHEVYPKGAVYCATKFAVNALTKGTRLDLHRFGIRVSQVSPAHVETEFSNVRFDGDTDRADRVYADFKPLASHDVANTLFFLATQPPHVNVQDIQVFGTQQASSMIIDRSGRERFEEEE